MWPEWERAEEFPRELFTRMGELGFLGLKYPEEYGGQGGDYVHDAVFAEEMARCGSGGVAAGIGAPHRHRDAADLQVRHRGAEAALAGARRSRARRSARWRSPSRARARTWRGCRTFARREGDEYVVNGVQDLHHERRAGRHLRDRGQDHPGRRPPRALVPRDRAGHARLQVSRKLEKLGWHASDTGELSFSGRARAGREPARRGEPGLLPDHGQLPVGAPADGARRGRRHAGHVRAHARPTRRSARRSAARSAASRRSGTSSPRWRP